MKLNKTIVIIIIILFVAIVGYGVYDVISSDVIGGKRTKTTGTSTSTPLSSNSVKVGDIVKFGSYEQDNNQSNGKEAIEWIVLAKENGKALVISKYALDCQKYNSTYTDVTWEKCSLRTWMNGIFLNNAFSADEQAKIAATTVSADKNPQFSTNPGNSTSDKVFLLSITEAEKYFTSDSARACKGTDYCYAQGAYKNSNGNCWWWLRSPGDDRNYAADVFNDGLVDYSGPSVDDGSGCVRPALWINLDA